MSRLTIVMMVMMVMVVMVVMVIMMVMRRKLRRGIVLMMRRKRKMVMRMWRCWGENRLAIVMTVMMIIW